MADSDQMYIQSLIEGCVQNDRSAQKELYAYYYPLMMPVCMGYTRNADDAVDIYNRAFLKIFQKIADYQGAGAFGGWVRRIMVRTAIDFIRAHEKEKYQTDVDEAINLSSGADPMESLLSDDIRQMIKKLPRMQRLVVNLYIIEGYNHKEIGEQLDISEGTSKWHLSEGRKKLKVLLSEAGITN